MLFSKQGFTTVDTTEEFVKQAIEFGNKDIVLSVVHDNGVIDIVISPTMDAIEAEVYHSIHAYLSEAFKVAEMFRSTTRQSTDYAK
jgi:hypothetical protein